jgi:hypothetical protein
MRQVELVERENTDLEGYERLYIERFFFSNHHLPAPRPGESLGGLEEEPGLNLPG